MLVCDPKCTWAKEDKLKVYESVMLAIWLGGITRSRITCDVFCFFLFCFYINEILILKELLSCMDRVVWLDGMEYIMEFRKQSPSIR